MRRLTRKASVWALAGLFGSISLFGQGWHCFLGHHGPGGCHEHGHGAACASDHEHEAPAGPTAAPLATAHDDDCAICNFFAQAQWVLELAPAQSEPVFFDESPAGEVDSGVGRIGSYHSRAPPREARIS